eukprot:5169316-Prymnesium_polylepis.2
MSMAGSVRPERHEGERVLAVLCACVARAGRAKFTCGIELTVATAARLAASVPMLRPASRRGPCHVMIDDLVDEARRLGA